MKLSSIQANRSAFGLILAMVGATIPATAANLLTATPGSVTLT